MLLKELLAHNGGRDTCAAADAEAGDQLEGGEDREEEAPSSHRLTTEPCLEHSGVDYVDERGDSGQTAEQLDAGKEAPTSCGASLFTTSARCGSATNAAAAHDPVQHDEATQHPT